MTYAQQIYYTTKYYDYNINNMNIKFTNYHIYNDLTIIFNTGLIYYVIHQMRFTRKKQCHKLERAKGMLNCNLGPRL